MGEMNLLIIHIATCLIALMLSLSAPSCVFSIHRSFFVIQAILFLIYTLAFLNPLTIHTLTTSEFVINALMFELFASGMINLIFCVLVYQSTVFPILTIASFLWFPLIFFIAKNVCEWTIPEIVGQKVCQFYTYEVIHGLLIVSASIVYCFSLRKYGKFEIAKVLPVSLFMLLLYVGICQILKVLVVFYDAEYNLRNFLNILPLTNLVMLILVNCQHPNERKKMFVVVKKLIGGSPIVPIPQISIEEPGRVRSHIATSLMRNPINSYNKLLRQHVSRLPNILENGESLENRINEEHISGFLEIPRDTTPGLEAPPRSSPIPENTVDILRRASLVSITFRRIIPKNIDQDDSIIEDCGCHPDQQPDSKPVQLCPEFLTQFISNTPPVESAGPLKTKKTSEHISRALSLIIEKRKT